MSRRIALLGKKLSMFARLEDILNQAGFVVDAYDPAVNPDIIDNRLHTYDVIIANSDLVRGMEEDALFESSITARAFLVYDNQPSEREIGSSYLIHSGMNPEDIVAKINDIIFISSTVRKSPRVKLYEPVIYEYEGTQCQSMLQDIGEYGAFISTLVPPPDGTQISVRFILPGEREITALGHIVYSIKCNLDQNIITHPASRDRKIIALPGVGIMFDKISDIDREAIKSFMNKNR